MVKIITWIGLTIASILGITQAVVKFIKEVLTAVVNILFPLFPDGGKFETVVTAVRAFVEKADTWIENIKKVLIPTT